MPADAAARRRPESVRWVPRQFGAWAILAVPLLLGVAASRPTAWHLILAISAACAYLASVAALEWARGRRPAYLRPATVFGAGFAASGLVLVTVAPALALVAVFVAALAAVTFVAARASGPRGFLVGLVEIAQALALAPAAALVAGVFEPRDLALATLTAGLYLIGSLLLVRSLIRERGNRAFLAASLGYHAAAAVVAAWLLPWPYVAVMGALLGRAALLPAVQARLATDRRHLRPIHVGLVEIGASSVLVALGFVVGF